MEKNDVAQKSKVTTKQEKRNRYERTGANFSLRLHAFVFIFQDMQEIEKQKVVVIIQARMKSSRLPGKVMLQVLKRPLLSYLLERVGEVGTTNEMIVATGNHPDDQPIVELCQEQGIRVFRGSDEDVLDRYLQAAREYHADVVVRITADCPLIDPNIIERVIRFYLDNTYDYVSNTLVRTYPRGMDAEVFSRTTLEKTAYEAKAASEREHVTLFMYRHPEMFRLFYYTINF